MSNWKSSIKEMLTIVVTALILSLVLRTFVIEARYVPTGSMLPTLQLQDRILVNKFIYHFKDWERGDIIVFKPPVQSDGDFIKRIIGLPGDVVEVKDGKVYVNNEPLDEPYIKEAPNYEFGPVEVPPGKLFVMGDNRNESWDSHAWQTWLPVEDVKGKAFMIYWPFSHMGLLR